MILDRMLPEMDGLILVRAIRASGVATPVLLLTALGGIDDRVEGLEAGGDDYLVKPFAMAELLARVNALARRPAAGRADDAGGRRPEARSPQADRDPRRARIELQPREFQLLEYLMRIGAAWSPAPCCWKGLGLPLRSEDEHRRDAHEPTPGQGRPRAWARAHPHRARRRLHAACPELGCSALRASASRRSISRCSRVPVLILGECCSAVVHTQIAAGNRSGHGAAKARRCWGESIGGARPRPAGAPVTTRGGGSFAYGLVDANGKRIAGEGNRSPPGAAGWTYLREPESDNSDAENKRSTCGRWWPVLDDGGALVITDEWRGARGPITRCSSPSPGRSPRRWC